MIKFENVSKTYPNGVKGLKNINLEIEQGEFVSIIGLSGAGKSTLIRTINRMLDISEGKLTVDGIDVTKLKGKSLRKFRRNKVGMIFQSFNLVTRTTVIKNVLTSIVPDIPFFRSLFGIYTKQEKLHALEALDKVGIVDKAFIRADQLSGGQQQRVAIGRAMITDPSLLLADEPTGALDSKSASNTLDLFDKINENGQTILMVTHSTVAASRAKRVLFIKDGLIYNQLYRGERSDQQMFELISETLTVMANRGEAHV